MRQLCATLTNDSLTRQTNAPRSAPITQRKKNRAPAHDDILDMNREISLRQRCRAWHA